MWEETISIKEKRRSMFLRFQVKCVSPSVWLFNGPMNIVAGMKPVCDLSGIDRDTLGRAELENINA